MDVHIQYTYSNIMVIWIKNHTIEFIHALKIYNPIQTLINQIQTSNYINKVGIKWV